MRDSGGRRWLLPLPPPGYITLLLLSQCMGRRLPVLSSAGGRSPRPLPPPWTRSGSVLSAHFGEVCLERILPSCLPFLHGGKRSSAFPDFCQHLQPGFLTPALLMPSSPWPAPPALKGHLPLLSPTQGGRGGSVTRVTQIPRLSRHWVLSEECATHVSKTFCKLS